MLKLYCELFYSWGSNLLICNQVRMNMQQTLRGKVSSWICKRKTIHILEEKIIIFEKLTFWQLKVTSPLANGKSCCSCCKMIENDILTRLTVKRENFEKLSFCHLTRSFIRQTDIFLIFSHFDQLVYLDTIRVF